MDGRALSDQLSVLEPATEEVLEQVPRAGPAEVDAAVARTREAFPAWRALAPGVRAGLLRDLAAALEDRLEELAVLEAILERLGQVTQSAGARSGRERAPGGQGLACSGHRRIDIGRSGAGDLLEHLLGGRLED